MCDLTAGNSYPWRARCRSTRIGHVRISDLFFLASAFLPMARAISAALLLLLRGGPAGAIGIGSTAGIGVHNIPMLRPQQPLPARVAAVSCAAAAGADGREGVSGGAGGVVGKAAGALGAFVGKSAVVAAALPAALSGRDRSVLVLLMAAFLNLLGFTMMSPLNPELGRHFGLEVRKAQTSLSRKESPTDSSPRHLPQTL